MVKQLLLLILIWTRYIIIALALLEVLVLLAICYSTVISGISNNYIYVITCVSVIDSGNTT